MFILLSASSFKRYAEIDTDIESTIIVSISDK